MTAAVEIALVDYGAGNLTSVRKGLAAAGAAAVSASSPEALAEARGIVVPGVGQVKVNLTFDPPWDMSRMSDEARLALNMF